MDSNHKAQTNKYYYERMNLVWLYIQNNLDEKLKLEHLASLAFLSPYHFHRIFTAITGESINQYIRRLRLERAANKILLSDEDITKIGLDNGYQTASAFSRAFKQRFKISPSKFRKNKDITIKNFPHDPQENISAAAIDYNIVHLKPQKVRFIRKVGHYSVSAAQAWQNMMNYIDKHTIDLTTLKRFGIPLDTPVITEENNIRYDACIAVDAAAKADGEFGIQIIKGGKYAEFTHLGSYDKLKFTYNNIIFKWIPNINYELLDAPLFEEYLNNTCAESKPQDFVTKIYIPIQ